VGENSSFPSMVSFINTTVCIEGVLSWWEDGVKLRLLDIRFMSVDSLQSSVAIN
jgi:hypothetical protein